MIPGFEKMNYLILKLNSIGNGNVSFEMPQVYQEKLCRRFGTSNRS
jgi:hypothetical protein